MWFFPKCAICNKFIETPHQPVVSYFKEIDGCRVTKACCHLCSRLTNEEWIEKGYQKVKDES
jgi:hypothetical protein